MSETSLIKLPGNQYRLRIDRIIDLARALKILELLDEGETKAADESPQPDDVVQADNHST